MRHSLNNTLSHKHTFSYHRVYTETHTHGKTNNTSLLVLYVVKSMDVDVIGDIYGVCCSVEAVQTSHCILDRFLYIFFSTKSLYQHSCFSFCLVKFLLESKIMNITTNTISLHRGRFWCKFIRRPSRGSCVKSESVHIQYVVSLKYRND